MARQRNGKPNAGWSRTHNQNLQAKNLKYWSRNWQYFNPPTLGIVNFFPHEKIGTVMGSFLFGGYPELSRKGNSVVGLR